MSTIVGIKFKDAGKIYYFSPKKLVLCKGDGVIVETARGLEYGEVEIANTEVDDAELKGELKNVVRKATDKDVSQHKSNVEKRPRFIKEAQDLANKYKLDMKIVDAELAFDGSKVLFYFTSDNRVDFRELVKDMAGAFRMRIELRQIGIRDECKMKGGLGPCGRACCCNSYMADFARVSIKMAKNQGLSLNPGKISGLCGRLMCCLKFEDEYYAETLKFMPKVNADISTPNGKGKVASVDVLRQTVVVKIVNKDDETEVHEYTLEQLGISTDAKAGNACAIVDEEDDSDVLPPDEE